MKITPKKIRSAIIGSFDSMKRKKFSVLKYKSEERNINSRNISDYNHNKLADYDYNDLSDFEGESYPFYLKTTAEEKG